MAKLTFVRLFISLVVFENCPLLQLDIKNAFIHGEIQEEVHMDQSPDFISQEEYVRIFHLKKTFNGLKQSPRAWFGKFGKVV